MVRVNLLKGFPAAERKAFEETAEVRRLTLRAVRSAYRLGHYDGRHGMPLATGLVSGWTKPGRYRVS